MSFSIALSGKGGTGKSTIAALIVRSLVESGSGATLAVDADPNSNLGFLFGVDVEATVADIREETVDKSKSFPAGMSKDRWLELQIQQSIVEGRGFDLLTMGRPEGPGCYCFVNHLLREFLNSATQGYEFVVMDNEAGMEHLSRRTTNDVELLLIVVEPGFASLVAAQRVIEIAEKLPITVREKRVIMNRCSEGELSNTLLEKSRSLGIKIDRFVPRDETVERVFSEGGTVFDLPADTPAYSAVRTMVEELVPVRRRQSGG